MAGAAGSSIETQSPGWAFRASIRPRVQLDGPARDRQAQADAAAGAAPVAADAIEGLEDRLQAILRERLDRGPGSRPSRWRSSCRSSTATVVPSGAWRTALRSTFSTARRSSSRSPRTTAGPCGRDAQAAAFGAGLERVVLGQGRTRSRSARFSGSREDGSPSAWVSFRSSSTSTVSRPTSRVIRSTAALRVLTRAGQLDGEGEPGQRRTQLVRDVLEQPALDGQQGLDPLRHLVEGPGQVADLVPARRSHPCRQVALAEPIQARRRSRSGPTRCTASA